MSVMWLLVEICVSFLVVNGFIEWRVMLFNEVTKRFVSCMWRDMADNWLQVVHLLVVDMFD